MLTPELRRIFEEWWRLNVLPVFRRFIYPGDTYWWVLYGGYDPSKSVLGRMCITLNKSLWLEFGAIEVIVSKEYYEKVRAMEYTTCLVNPAGEDLILPHEVEFYMWEFFPIEGITKIYLHYPKLECGVSPEDREHCKQFIDEAEKAGAEVKEVVHRAPSRAEVTHIAIAAVERTFSRAVDDITRDVDRFLYADYCPTAYEYLNTHEFNFDLAYFVSEKLDLPMPEYEHREVECNVDRLLYWLDYYVGGFLRSTAYCAPLPVLRNYRRLCLEKAVEIVKAGRYFSNL